MSKYDIGDFVKFVDRPSDQILEGIIVRKYYESGIQMMAYDVKVKDGFVYQTIFETNIDAHINTDTSDQTAKSDAGGTISQMKVGDYVKFSDKYEETHIGKIHRIFRQENRFEVIYESDKGCTSNYFLNFDEDYTILSEHTPSQDAKADAGKLQLTLVPTQIIKDIAEVRMYGNRKYGDPDNWKTVEESRYKDAAFRHFLAYLDEPDGIDEESGIAHLKHLACNIAFLCEFYEKRNRKE